MLRTLFDGLSRRLVELFPPTVADEERDHRFAHWITMVGNAM